MVLAGRGRMDRRRPLEPLPAPAPLSGPDARRLDDDLARHDG